MHYKGTKRNLILKGHRDRYICSPRVIGTCPYDSGLPSINITVLHINDAKIVQKIDLAKENIDYFFSEREFLYKSWNHRYRYLTYTRKSCHYRS